MNIEVIIIIIVIIIFIVISSIVIGLYAFKKQPVQPDIIEQELASDIQGDKTFKENADLHNKNNKIDDENKKNKKDARDELKQKNDAEDRARTIRDADAKYQQEINDRLQAEKLSHQTKLWKNCVDLQYAAYGIHDDYCHGEFGTNWSHIGLDQAGCPLGQARGICSPN